MTQPTNPAHPATPTSGALPPACRGALLSAVGPEHLRTRPFELRAYAYDATGEKHLPAAVVFPGSPEEVAACVRIARSHGLPVVARGAGTNLSGGTTPVAGGLVLNLSRLNRVLAIEPENGRAVVEPGVTNGALQAALKPYGYFFAPDPSSQRVATIGGNVAENADGPHCLKYGVTAGHVLALQVVTAEGDLLELGSPLAEDPGYDWPGLFCGSEGTLGIITRAAVRILPLPAATRTLLAVFADLEASSRAVAEIIAAQIIPAALELIDGATIDLARASGFGAYPEGAEAALVIDVDGDPADLSEESDRIVEILHATGALSVRAARDEAEAAELWLGRRASYGAMARTSPFIWTQDVTVPRDRLPEMLRAIMAVGRELGLSLITVAHAGDGNLHPSIPFNPHDPRDVERVRQADAAIIDACLRLGGSITGEHGVGLDKLPGMLQMFSPAQLAFMRRVRQALDPEGFLNPGKLLPTPKGGF